MSVSQTLCLLLCALTLPRPSYPQNIPSENIPQQLSLQLGTGQFAKLYDLDASINPFYLRGDFDGDGKTDYAIRIKSIATHEAGIAIWMSSRHRFVVLGASRPFKMNDGTITDFRDLDVWQVYGRRPVEKGVDAGPPPRLLAEAILAGKSESASGLIYWTGHSFRWYQQGD